MSETNEPFTKAPSGQPNEAVRFITKVLDFASSLDA